MFDRLRSPLVPGLAILLLALAPARLLGWTNDAAAILWLPLRPASHLGVAAASWLRPPTTAPPADAVMIATQRDELLALVQRLRAQLEVANESIRLLEGMPRDERPMPPPIAAQIVGVEPGGVVALNVGRRHGVSAGDPVVAEGGRLAGRIGDPVGLGASVLVPATHAGGLPMRVRLLGERPEDRVLCLLEPTGDGWRAEVDAKRVAAGGLAHLDDPSWPDSAQGLLLGRVSVVRGVPERPLRASIRVTPAWSADDGRVLVVQRTSLDAEP